MGWPAMRGTSSWCVPDGDMLSIALFDSEQDAEAAEETFDVEMPSRLGHLFRTGRDVVLPAAAVR